MAGKRRLQCPAMSIDIAVWVSDENADWRVIDAPPEVSTAVGGERCRYDLWGSAAAKRLGATYLPRLGDIDEVNRGMLRVPPGELEAFDSECALLTENVERLEAATGYDTDRILGYLGNMRDANARARAVGGGIVIW